MSDSALAGMIWLARRVYALGEFDQGFCSRSRVTFLDKEDVAWWRRPLQGEEVVGFSLCECQYNCLLRLFRSDIHL